MPNFLDPHDPRYLSQQYQLPHGVKHFYSDATGFVGQTEPGWYYLAPNLVGPFPTFDALVADYREHFSTEED